MSCIERVARCGSGRDNVRGVVGTMNAARSRPDWLATVQSGRKQVQSRVCTPGLTHIHVNNTIMSAIKIYSNDSLGIVMWDHRPGVLCHT